MATGIPLPERGQPLDVTYIYELAKTVNLIANDVSPSTYKYVTFDIEGSLPDVKKVTDISMTGAYRVVVNSASKNVGDEAPFSVNFAKEFQSIPIVTATPVNIGNTVAGKNVSVIINNITTSGVQGIVRFNSNGDVSVGVNLIIIGIPNS